MAAERRQPRSKWHSAGLALAGLTLVALVPSISTAGDEAAKAPDTGIVVHFGDSFVNAGLQQTLRPKFRSMNARYITAGKTSSWLSTWAMGQALDNLYWGYRPSLFLVTVGANDLFFSPADKRAYLVHEIVRKMRGTPCVWIGIPIWETAPTEFVEMMRRESAPCRYFDSNTITTQITRQADKRHPDRAGGRLWAETFWDWLMAQRNPDEGSWALKPAPTAEHAPRPAPDPWGKTEEGEKGSTER